MKELQHVLTEDEVITNAANGRYQGGFALIVTTNHRLLLIDKKLWFMSMEDVRFDMITEVDYAARVFDATISVRTINKVLHFTSFHQKHLRNLTHYLQARILELRQMMMQQAQMPTAQAVMQTQMPVQPQVQYLSMAPAQQFQPQDQTYLQDQPQPQPTPTNATYSRPGRLRRMGAFPTASFTISRQRYITARR